MTSSDPEAYPVFQCCFCDRSYYNKRALGAHRRFCKLKVTGQNAAGQEEAASNAQGGIDVLNFRIARRQRTVRKKEEALPVLSEQSENNPASDDAQVGNNGASGFHMPKRKRPILTEPTTSDVKADWEPEKEVYVLEPLLLLQEQPGKEPGSDGEPGTANPDDELAADNPDEVLTTCFDKSSSSVECYRGCERWGNLPAVVGREVERLSHNEGIDVLNFHIARRQRTVRKKEALPVLSEQPENNPDSDDAQVGNNGASGFHMPKAADNPDEVLTTCFDKSSSSVECYGGCERWGNLPAVVGREAERLSHNDGSQGVTDCVDNYGVMHNQNKKFDISDPVVTQQQNQKLDLNVLAPTDNSDKKTLTLSFSTMEQKNSASVDCYGGIEKNGNEAPVVEEELELSHNFGRQGVADCPENSAVMELRGHNKLDLNVCSFVQEQNVEPDLKVSDDSVVMQEKNLNIDLNAPVPTINSDKREGQTKLTATDNFLKKSGNEVPVAVKEDVLPSASDHHLSLMQEQNQKLEVKPKLPDLNL